MQELSPSQFSAGERRWALLCYVPFFNVIFALIASVRMVESPLCRFHARQGLVLCGVWFLSMFFAALFPLLGVILWGVVLLFHGLGGVSAFSGVLYPLPVVSRVAQRIPEYYLFVLLTGKRPPHT